MSGITVVEVCEERQEPWGVVRDEVWECGGERTRMVSAYTPAGAYIGNLTDAHFLCVTKGIVPEKRDPDDSACTIGFCAREQQWYGWSHRAIFGFGVGHRVKPGDVAADQFPEGFVAQTMDDAKRLASAFAEDVG